MLYAVYTITLSLGHMQFQIKLIISYWDWNNAITSYLSSMFLQIAIKMEVIS